MNLKYFYNKQKKLFFYLTLLLTLVFNVTDLNAQCSTTVYYNTSDQKLKSANLSTGASTTICSNFYDGNSFTDIGFAPDGTTLYAVIRGDGNNHRLYRINTTNCTYTILSRTGSVQPSSSTINSLTFLPDGTALIGYNSANTIQRVTINTANNTYTLSDWFTPVYSGLNGAGGDFLLLGNKVYACMKTSSQNVIFECAVDGSYNYSSTIATYTNSASTHGLIYGMASLNGKIYGGFSDQTIKELTFSGTSINVSANLLNSLASGEIYGMTSSAEAKGQGTPTITSAGGATTFCTGSSIVLTSNVSSGNQWYRNGTAISGATNATYTATQGGNYTVRVDYGGGCLSNASNTITLTASATPAIPTVTTVVATCSAAGTVTVSNYSTSLTYTFSPTGPTVGAGGVISNATAGTSYTVRASNGTCTSAPSASFTRQAQLSSPVDPPVIANYQSGGNFIYSKDNSSYYIPCGSTTANLSVLVAENLTSGTTLTWHTATPATDANRINPATAVTGATRKMYAAFRSSAGCFSPTKEIIVYAPICATDDDYSATPITAGVGGTLPSIFGNDTYNGVTITTASSGNVGFQYSQWTPANGSINPSTGVLTVPATTPPGIYMYSYQINDVDSDALLNSNFSTASVLFRVVADSDGDGLHDEIDLDDDNDGILDKDECGGFIANNVTRVWKGRTPSNVTVSASPSTTQTNTQFITVDPQVNFSVNRDGGDQRFGNSATATSFVLTFSTPVPANEIGLMIDDVNVASNRSPNAAFKIEVDFGSGFTDPQGTFIKTMAGRNSGVGYNAITGIPSFQDLPNPDDLGGEDIYLRGFGNTLVKAVRITGTNLGGSADAMSYSFFALSPCDTDGDGIPNDLDLDSDNDGCVDAIEGGENVAVAQLQTASGTVSVGFGSSASNQNLGNTVNANGVPVIVNPGGAADTGSATQGTIGQPVGSSVNPLINPCCTNPPNSNPATDFTQTGISTLQGFANGWPNNVPNGFIAIESKNKGFVITRVNHVGGTNGTPNLVTDSVKQPVEGMLVYDIQDSCVKLFNGTRWTCLAKDCGTPTN